MGEQNTNKNIPLKVTIFADSPFCVGTINMLAQQKQLAGVILPQQSNAFTQQLILWLQQMNILYTQFSFEQTGKILDELSRWESDLALSFNLKFNFSSQFLTFFRYGLYHCHCSLSPNFQETMSLYWQLRGRHKQTKITLQKANLSNEHMMLVNDLSLNEYIEIEALDTLQSLENKITAKIPFVIYQLLQKLNQQQGTIELKKIQLKTTDEALSAIQVKEGDLKVDWHNMEGEYICALARAGNPHMGGCIVMLGETAINLLQTTCVTYPTYGVPAGTICHTGKPDNVVVATMDGAIRLDILSNADGIFSGVAFCEKFQVGAGMTFT